MGRSVEYYQKAGILQMDGNKEQKRGVGRYEMVAQLDCGMLSGGSVCRARECGEGGLGGQVL